MGLLGAVLSYILSVVVTVLFLVFLVRQSAKLYFDFNKKLIKDSVTYGGKVYIANSISFLNYRFDMFLIAFFLNPAAVGIYSIAVALSERIFVIPHSFSTVLVPKISSSSELDANQFTPKVIRHTLFIVIILSLVLFIVAKYLILLFFGSDFMGSVLPLIILLPGIIAFAIGGVIASYLSGRGRPEFAAYSSSACLVVNLILNIILIPRIGIAGAAVASSIGYIVDTLIVLVAFIKMSGQSLKDTLIIKRDDIDDYLRLIDNIKLKLWKKEK